MIGWSGHLSTIYADLPVPRRPPAAADDGLAAVETWWIDERDQEAWLAAVERADLDVVVITAPAGDLSDA